LPASDAQGKKPVHRKNQAECIGEEEISKAKPLSLNRQDFRPLSRLRCGPQGCPEARRLRRSIQHAVADC
jgi:hypothetical protein